MPQVSAVLVGAFIFTMLYDPFHVGILCFLALTPITIVFANAHHECSPLRAALSGFAFGLLASLAIVGPWMYSAAADYFQYGTFNSLWFIVTVNAGHVAVFTALAFLGIRILASAPPLVRVFGAASIWTACEALRASDAGGGNVWAQLGQGFAYLPVLREAAAYGGQPLLGWSAALCGAAVGVGMQADVNARNSRVSMNLAILSLIALAALGGLEYWRDPDKAPMKPLRVAVVQAEIPSKDVWDPAQRMAHWDAYVSATETIQPGSVDLVVWPESAVPFLLDADVASRTRLMDISTNLGAAILLGAPRSEKTEDGRAKLHNSAYFFSGAAHELRTYDKQRLLPYVETTAMPGTELPDGMDYAAGTEGILFDVRGWKIAPLLCFEAVYPEYAREAVLAGAHLLVNLSNDAWFADGAGPEQHYAMSLMRTLELRRPMIRASNGGISGAIGEDGNEIGFSVRRHKAVGMYEIPAPSRRITFTARFPGLVNAIATVIAIGSLLIGLRRLFTVEPPPPVEVVEDTKI